MQGQRLPLTETAYLAAISASQAVRNWQVATELFWKAQQQGVAGAANLMRCIDEIDLLGMGVKPGREENEQNQACCYPGSVGTQT